MDGLTKVKFIPLRRLYDENVKLSISADLPSINGASLIDEYNIVVEKFGMTIDELEEIALNALDSSFLPEEDKVQMRETFAQEYKSLRDEHLSEEAPEGSD